MHLNQWDKSLSVGIEEIDEQHRQLIGILHTLEEAMNQGKGKDVVEGVLLRLREYTRTHFAMEEKYFEKFGYPDSKGHRLEHGIFISKLEEFQVHFLEHGKLDICIKLLPFLTQWLRHHIKVSDQAYASFFRENGLV